MFKLVSNLMIRRFRMTWEIWMILSSKDYFLIVLIGRSKMSGTRSIAAQILKADLERTRPGKGVMLISSLIYFNMK